MPSEATNSGIITDLGSGERHIPESVRPDGSTRKAIKIRPGYRPPEDVEVYKNRTAESFRERGRRMGIPGASGLKEEGQEQSPSAASSKNAKRREARKKAKATEDGQATNPHKQASVEPSKSEEVDPVVEREKKARSLKKKLKQARDLKNKKDDGQALLPEQVAKVIKINELIRELDALGFDSDGEPKPSTSDGSPKPTADGED